MRQTHTPLFPDELLRRCLASMMFWLAATWRYGSGSDKEVVLQLDQAKLFHTIRTVRTPPERFVSLVSWILVDSESSMINLCDEEFRPLIARVASLWTTGCDNMGEYLVASDEAEQEWLKQKNLENYKSGTPLQVAHQLAKAGYFMLRFGILGSSEDFEQCDGFCYRAADSVVAAMTYPVNSLDALMRKDLTREILLESHREVKAAELAHRQTLLFKAFEFASLTD